MKITKELLAYATEKTEVKQRELLEKDMLLDILLKELMADKHFKTHYVFKGGTCLIKCYLGYYRFSEDLDFSYARPDKFEGKSEKQIRKQLAEEIDDVARKLETIAYKIDLDFKAHKHDRHYMEFGGSNKFTTFKLWYESSELKTAQFIKVQINYVEKFKYQFKHLPAKSILSGLDEKELRFRRPEAAQILEPIIVPTYDLREIMIEKVRAILTRKRTKVRDYIDVHLIQEETKVKPEDLEAEILDKTRFILKYEKYRENLLKKTTDTPTFRLGEEEKLLLKPLGKEFEQHSKQLSKYVAKLANKIE